MEIIFEVIKALVSQIKKWLEEIEAKAEEIEAAKRCIEEAAEERKEEAAAGMADIAECVKAAMVNAAVEGAPLFVVAQLQAKATAILAKEVKICCFFPTKSRLKLFLGFADREAIVRMLQEARQKIQVHERSLAVGATKHNPTERTSQGVAQGRKRALQRIQKRDEDLHPDRCAVGCGFGKEHKGGRPGMS